MSRLTSGERACILANAENHLKDFIHNQTDFESAFAMGVNYGMMHVLSMTNEWEVVARIDEIEQRRRDYRHGRKVLK